MSTEEANKTLANFLRNTASAIENDKISEDTLQKVKELYIATVIGKLIDEDEECQEVDSKDFLKFLFMGYWMYRTVLK